MGGEEDAFQQTATAGLNTLVLGLETRLDAGLQQMVRMPWASIEAVSSLESVVTEMSTSKAAGVGRCRAGCDLAALHLLHLAQDLAAQQACSGWEALRGSGFSRQTFQVSPIST